MEITLFNFNKRINSTKIPVSTGKNINVNLKDGTSIYSPSFIINDFDANYNYLKWDNRYYYITDVQLLRLGIYNIICTIDVLATYRNEIFNTTAFVDYAYSNYNPDIIDHRLTINPDVSYHINSALLLTDGDSAAGSYIVNYVTDNATYGATGLLWTNKTGVGMLAESLTNTEFFNLENLEKQFNNVYQALLGCKYVPFNWFDGSGPARAFRLGSYQTTVIGQVVSENIKYTVNVGIPWQYSDFRNLHPYTSLLVYLPGYGFVDVNPTDVYGKTTLNVELIIDGATGEGTYILNDFFKGTCNFATSVPIGTVTANVAGVVGNTLAAGTSIMTGNIIGAIGSAVTAGISSMHRSVGNIGSLGSLSALFATVGSDWRNVYIIAITHDTAEQPVNVASTMGRPLQKVVRLGTINGYCQTQNASCMTNNIDMAAQINSYLDGGVYLE